MLDDGREVGYAIKSTCEAPDCNIDIDRGLSYLCGEMHGQDDEDGCGHYFCQNHLFLGPNNWMCERCLNWIEEDE